ncbi:MAG TPA: peptidyl-prolyl cis-trans isomerase [Gemmatimonadales bacterium]|nr:peptidyl-prolyl cis-trans isomerase [Gemmatimonadales bacterium]
MLRTMRRIATPVFWVVAIAFVGWLAYGQVTQILGGGRDVVLRVNGQEVHLPEYNIALQGAYDHFRRETGRPMTREDEQEVDQQVIDELTQQLLLSQQYHRLGITVTDQEVIQAAQSSPPPEVTDDSEFQTNGQFDITKWQRFLSATSDPQFLQNLEQRYRQQIPEAKLAEYLTADVAVSDGKLWRIFRDQHESVTVALLALRPELIPDAEAPVSDGELAQYYAAHKTDFKRQTMAWLSFVGLPRLPDAQDSSLAWARARRVRAEIVAGAKFDSVAKRESADSGTASKGGDLGWIHASQQGFDPRFMAAARTLRPGALSEPVLSSFGLHLIHMDAAAGDSAHLRHILIPIELQGAHLDFVESRADTLDKSAAERSDVWALDSAAKHLGLTVTHGVSLIQGDRMTLDGNPVPDVSVWAFEAKVGETSTLIEADAAYYVFRLDSLIPAGTPPLGEIQDLVRDAVRMDKKKALLAKRATALSDTLARNADLAKVAHELGVPLETLGPFTRLAPPPVLQGNPYIVGVAFGMAPGTHSSVVRGATGYFVLQSLRRTRADSGAWVAQQEAQREAILQPVRQMRIQAFLAAVKAKAKVVDRRKQVLVQGPAS